MGTNERDCTRAILERVSPVPAGDARIAAAQQKINRAREDLASAPAVGGIPDPSQGIADAERRLKEGLAEMVAALEAKRGPYMMELIDLTTRDLK